MYSQTDGSLPFGPPEQSRGRGTFFTKKSYPSWSGTECDLYEAKQRVKNAYRDLIINY